MELRKILFIFVCIVLIESIVIENENTGGVGEVKSVPNNNLNEVENDPGNVFNGVYTECFLYWSYSCLQRKTLMYLKHLNNMSDITVIGDYVKFVKLNTTVEENPGEEATAENTEELSIMIDNAVDKFFDNHVLKFNALGKNVTVPHTVEGFVGRKKRKGGGGGGGHDDGGKKKMMMMAMMCMKMKFMMMVPAMMGMMGMMSFKGMMFSMMSFMISKMMLLMKLLEKKGGAGSGGGGDGSWAAGAGGGGAWMPAGGQDYGGGGYDANGQWQSRSIPEHSNKIENEEIINNKPLISYVTPIVRYSNNVPKKPFSIIKTLDDEVIKANQEKKVKSRKKRGIIDMLQNSYFYWLSKILGTNKNVNTFPKYKIINGVKYIYYPIRQFQRPKSPKAITNNHIKNVDDGFKPIITAEDFNKGEIIEAPGNSAESRMNRKKFHKMKDTVSDTVDENPWE